MRVTNALLSKKQSFAEKERDEHHSRASFTSFGDFGGNERNIKTKSYMYILLAFLAMGFTGVTFIFSIAAYNSTSQRTFYISQMINNWKMSPIVSITSTTDSHWPNDYDPMISKIWPGTFTGWYCDESVDEPKIRGSLVKGAWDKLQRNSGWKEIDEQNPIIIRKFYTNYLIWIQRMGDPIIDISRPYQYEGQQCPSNLKLWGPPNDVYLQTWIDQTQDWPIIDIVFDTPGNETSYDYTEVFLDNKNSLYYSSNSSTGGLPISEFIMSEGGKLCINQQDTNFDEGKKLYPLLNDNFYKGCNSNVDGMKYDTRWEELIDITETSLYKSNPLINSTLSSLPLYFDKYVQDSTIYTLYQRSYIDWNQNWEGHESSKMRNLAENLNPINTLVNAQLFYMVICFLSLLVMGVTTPIFVIIRHCMVLRGEKREVYKDVIVSTGIRFVSIIIIVLKASFLVSWLVLISKYDYIYHYAKDHNCTDDTTIFVLGYIDEYLENAKHYDWVGLIAVFVMTFWEIWTIIFLFYLQKKSEKEKKDYREILLNNIDNDDRE